MAAELATPIDFISAPLLAPALGNVEFCEGGGLGLDAIPLPLLGGVLYKICSLFHLADVDSAGESSLSVSVLVKYLGTAKFIFF